MIQFLKEIRHNSFLKRYKKFWLILGNLYRYIFSFSKFYFKVNISKYGKFRLHNKFFFSNFENWSDKHNSLFDKAIDLCYEKKIIIDVGAHIGLFSLCAARNSKTNSKIYAFEPSKINFTYLKNHIEKNNLTLKINPIKLLLGKNNKEIDFYSAKDVSGKNSIVNYEDFQKIERVKQISLDYFCKKIHIIPDVIKIDAEGAELDILQGSVNILKKYKPVIFLSVHPRILKFKNQSTDEIYKFLINCGYKIFNKYGEETNELKLDEYFCS